MKRFESVHQRENYMQNIYSNIFTPKCLVFHRLNIQARYTGKENRNKLT